MLVMHISTRMLLDLVKHVSTRMQLDHVMHPVRVCSACIKCSPHMSLVYEMLASNARFACYQTYETTA